jgi:hypothetical protein
MPPTSSRLPLLSTARDAFAFAPRALMAARGGLAAYLLLASVLGTGVDFLQVPPGTLSLGIVIAHEVLALGALCIWLAQVFRVGLERDHRGPWDVRLSGQELRQWVAHVLMWVVIAFGVLMVFAVGAFFTGSVMVATGADLGQAQELVAQGLMVQALGVFTASPAGIAVLLVVVGLSVVALIVVMRFIAVGPGTADLDRVVVLEAGGWTRGFNLRLAALGALVFILPHMVLLALTTWLTQPLQARLVVDDMALIDIFALNLAYGALNALVVAVQAGAALAVYRRIAPRRPDVSETFG